MYDLDTRGRLLVLAAKDHSLVRVASEDCSVREAFDLVDALSEEDPQEHHSFPHVAPGYGYDMPAWVYAIVPAGVDWEPSSGTDAVESVMWHMRGGKIDTTEDAPCFSYGEELIDEEADEIGFSRAVFRDGQPHSGWWPVD